jgi:asparagine synthase (glutamine-hydrolysing)
LRLNNLVRKITFLLATSRNQCLGYWGYDDSHSSVTTLKTIVAQATETQWQINSQSDFSLSASGLLFNSLPESDLWVQMAENSLTLGRQAFGRMTCYWIQCQEVIWFASQLQLLLPLISSPKINLSGLYGYSCFSYVPTPLTPVQEIMAIPAGTQKTWQLDQWGNIITTQSNISPEWYEHKELQSSEKDAIAQLQNLLINAVTRQIADIQDETVGVFLSGGLDSSIVATLLVQAGVKVRAYTLNFGDYGISEYPYAEQVAQWLNIPLVKVDATPQQIKPALIPTVKALDMPFGDGVTVPLYLLYQRASQDTQIIFNGEGGDQLFAGWTNKPLIATGVYQSEHPKENESFAQQYLRTFHRLWGYEAKVFQPEVYQEIQHLHPENWLSPALNSTEEQSLLHRLRRASLMLKGSQNIHPRATNLALAHGLKIRSPFCDLPLTQWTFQLSGELFLQGNCEKYILKRAVESWLPPEIVWRQKRGMGVPLTSWCLQEFWFSLGKWLNPRMLKAEGRWQADLAWQIIQGNLGGMIQGRRMGEILWLLIMWQLWRHHVVGESITEGSWNHPFWLPYKLWKYCQN